MAPPDHVPARVYVGDGVVEVPHTVLARPSRVRRGCEAGVDCQDARKVLYGVLEAAELFVGAPAVVERRAVARVDL
eukprot:CAMPEP_0180246884 /NCGR_PEP_ID=MMETSP0987-20121128/35825_1 /TAXON_ID=697907 /ORGANISM="non described non described, Strain CCMP2293" /LENGTH=75 /DNA_ID=CAMNT_0022214755 /DNA_START=182 /DNA_END=410 /DNA_ORIENTATION=-